MDIPEASIQSFMIKLWIEQVEEAGTQKRYHGSITHIPTGRRQTVRALQDITDFMVPYLQSEGIKFPWGQRLICWMAHCRWLR